MHIPDGYLGPQTYVPLWGIMVGMWALALRRVKATLRMRQVPLLALGAAFCFVIMMFNIPVPGGTTGHAVGAVLVAVLLGPWAAVIAVSLALVVQALLFQDGGITAIGANCFTMATVMPLVGWGIYRSLAGAATAPGARRVVAGAVAGYVGLNAAAVVTAILFGLQPGLAHDAAGRALYCPFGLTLAVPAMAFEHLLLFGLVEAAATGLVLLYVQRTAPELLGDGGRDAADVSLSSRLWPRLAAGLGVLILLSPLGLYLPGMLGAGSAWGEWSGEEVKAEVARTTGGEGYVPVGLAQAERAAWKAPLPDYGLAGGGSAPGSALAGLVYVVSGLLGAGLLVLLILPLRRLARQEDT